MDIKSRFDAKVSRNPETGCWDWTGALKYKNSVPVLWDQGGPQPKYSPNTGVQINYFRPALIISYELHIRPLQVGENVKRTCGNGLCVSPYHIRVTSRREKTTMPYKLTETDVRDIVEDYTARKPIKEIADTYDCSVSTVMGIMSGRIHRKITKLPRVHRPAGRRGPPAETVASILARRPQYLSGEVTAVALAKEHNVSHTYVRDLFKRTEHALTCS